MLPRLIGIRQAVSVRTGYPEVLRDRQMDVRQEIARKVDNLPPDLQVQVLRFVASLSTSAPVGENGEALLQFSSSLDSLSARQMIQAIEQECEQVEAGEW
jgi:hypothetical protein